MIVGVVGIFPLQKRILGINYDPANDRVGQIRGLERLVEQVMTMLPGSSSDITVDRAKKNGAYTFSGATDPTDAELWLQRVERVFLRINCPLERQVQLAVDLLEGSAYDSWVFTEAHHWGPAVVTWEEFRVYLLDRYFTRVMQDFKYRQF